MRLLSSRLSASVVAVCLAAVLALQHGVVFGEAAPTSARSELHQLLDSLTVAEEVRDGYDRDLFPHWTTTDGCTTRQWVLITESLTDGQIDHRCNIVSGGTWNSLYDGVNGITNPSLLDIDHVVPLAEAWDSGAHAWTTDRRRAFANDLDRDYTLIAVTAASNRSKGDKDPAEWKPPVTDYWCQYATDWVRIKADWELTVDAAEKAALVEMLDTCPEIGSPTTVEPTSSTTEEETSPTSETPTTQGGGSTTTTTEPGDTTSTTTTTIPTDPTGDAVDGQIVTVPGATGVTWTATDPTQVPDPTSDNHWFLTPLHIQVPGPGPHELRITHQQPDSPAVLWVFHPDTGWVPLDPDDADTPPAPGELATAAIDDTAVVLTLADTAPTDPRPGDDLTEVLGLALGFAQDPPAPGDTTPNDTTPNDTTPVDDETLGTVPADPVDDETLGTVPADPVDDETLGTDPASTAAEGSLPRTGSSPHGLLLAGFGAVLAGLLVLAAAAKARVTAAPAATNSAQGITVSRMSPRMVAVVAALTVAAAISTASLL